MGIIDKLTGKSHSGHSKHSDQTSTSAPAFGEASTFGGQNTTSSTTDNTTGYGNTTGTTGYDNSSTTGYGGERKKGIAEKGKEALGLDPKYNDPKDQGYSNTGTTGTTGLASSTTGTTGTTGYGDNTTGTTGYDNNSTTGYGGERKKGMGEKLKETVGLDPKYNDPKDQGYSNTTSTTGSSSTTGSLSDRISSGGDYTHDSRNIQHSAPIVAERVHDRYENIDKTRVEELHDRTEVKQVVQPIYDERTESVQRDRVDHGLEIHEHGKAGLDSRTEAELAAKRKELSSQYRSSHDESTTETSMRPDVDVQERTNVIEEVVPVVERDIYRPHETEHTKRVVEIHHEAPVLKGTTTKAPISLKEWESQGHSVSSYNQSRTRTGSSSSSSSSSDEEGRAAGTHTTRRKKGLGEKVKEGLGLDPKDQNDPKDQGYGASTTSTTGTGYGDSTTGYGNTTGTTGYDNSSTTGYGGERKKGIAEKGKEALGLDPKYNDPKDQGYSNTGTTGTTGLGSSTTGTTGTTGYGDNTTGTTGYDNNSTTGYGGERKKGMGEKLKETVGLDPKYNDPKDQGYAGGNVKPTTY